MTTIIGLTIAFASCFLLGVVIGYMLARWEQQP